MIFSISGVLLLGVVVFVLFRKDGLKVWHLIVCALFGFYLANTSIAPAITAGGRKLAGMIAGIHL